MQKLWIEPLPLKFDHREEDKLQKALEAMDQNLVLSPIASLQDVTLDSQARVGGKYHLTRWSLFQLCQLLCPSLYGFVAELSGANRTEEAVSAEYSFDEAVDIINRMLRRRYRERLLGKVMLRNGKEGTIDGFVGATYKWFANRELYTRVKEAMTQLDCNPRFSEAVLNGRWLLLRFLAPQPYIRFRTQVDNEIFEERFYRGFHFSNNEVGKASVRGANLLYRKISRSSSINPALASAQHVHHRGAKFQSRVNQLIGNVTNHVASPTAIMTCLERIRATALGLGHKNKNVQEKKVGDLVAKLTRQNIPVTIAKAVIANMFAQSSYEDVPPPIQSDPDKLTVYDLYNALGRVAVDLPINHRERAERAAHSILIGKITFA